MSAGSEEFGFGSLTIRAVTEIESPFCIGASIGVADPLLCNQGRGGDVGICSAVGVGCGVGSCPGGTLLVDVFGTLDLICASDVRFLKDHKEGDDFWPTGCGCGVCGGLPLASLREKDSRALIRVVMPDDTVPFFAAKAYPISPVVGGKGGSAVEVEALRPPTIRGLSSIDALLSAVICMGAEAARVTSPRRSELFLKIGVIGDRATDIGLACSSFACCNSSMNESSSDTSEASGLDRTLMGSTKFRRFLFRSGVSACEISEIEWSASMPLISLP